MPLFAEQSHNAHLVLAMGIGPVINKYTLTANSVYETIHRVSGKFIITPQNEIFLGIHWNPN
jgi:UDP:flavonoid glycosyltransferase YjiC (YdhE family)